MGRYILAACRLCRREGEKLFLKGEKCFTEKCPLSMRSYAPGQHGRIPVRASEYRIRMREKQKARRIYGLTERQFKKYYLEALGRKGDTGEKILELLERRLDNVIYRLGFTVSRGEARQLIRHGHILVNNRKVSIPSFQVKAGDLIKGSGEASPRIKRAVDKFPDRVLPPWLSFAEEGAGKILALPAREHVVAPLEMHLIVEYYSR